VARNKPAPDLYLSALEKLRADPGACVAIEDDAAGLASARGAGVPVVVTPSGYSAGEDFSGARAVVTHLGDPGNPAKPLSGPAAPGGVVDVAWLDGLRAANGRDAPA